MDKSFMVFIAIGIGFLYFVTSFVGDIQAEDEKYQNNNYNNEHLYDKYKTVDSIGQDILDLTGASRAVQFAAWNDSMLKDDFLDLFPNFSEMKLFVGDRITGQALQTKLNQKLEGVEDKFFSGTMTAEQAKRELSSLK
jgi:hypothetical protein